MFSNSRSTLDQSESSESSGSSTIPSDILRLFTGDGDDDFICLDCRSFPDFKKLCVANSMFLNFRDNIIRKRLKNKKMTVFETMSRNDNEKFTKMLESKKIESLKVILLVASLDDLAVGTVVESIHHSHPNFTCHVIAFKALYNALPSIFTSACEDIINKARIAQNEMAKNNKEGDGEDQRDVVTTVREWLYWGSEANATNKDVLKQLKITHVLNLTKNIEFLDGIEGKRIPEIKTLDHLKEAVAYLNPPIVENNRERKIFVHDNNSEFKTNLVLAAFLLTESDVSNEKAVDVAIAKLILIKPSIKITDEGKNLLREFHNFLISRIRIVRVSGNISSSQHPTLVLLENVSRSIDNPPSIDSYID